MTLGVSTSVPFPELVSSHPVLPLVLKSGDLEPRDNKILQNYIDHYARPRAGGLHCLPTTITNFYHHYIEVMMQMSAQPSERRHSADSISPFGHLGVKALLDAQNITREDLRELRESICALQNNRDRESGFSGLKYWFCGRTEEPLNNIQEIVDRYKNTEPGVQKYMVTLEVAKSAVEAWNRKWAPSHRKQLVHFLTRTAAGQPRFWEMWGLLFGLSTSMATNELLNEMMDVVFSVGRRVSVSQSELCVAFASIVYESRNKSGVLTYGDEFLPNQSLRIDGKELKCYETYCLLYIMHAVGYILGAVGYIQGLTLSHLGMGSTHLVHLLQTAGYSMVPHTLQVLNLSHNPLGKDGIVCLQPFLVKATSLTHLNLSRCDLGTSGTKALCKVIDCMPLLSLNLSRNYIDDAGVAALTDKWSKCCCLRDLDLSCNDVTDTGAMQIGLKLPNLMCLVSLRLYGNDIVGDGICAIYTGMDRLAAVRAPCGFLPREDTREGFTCSVYLEVCAIERERTYDRQPETVHLHVPRFTFQDANIVGYDEVDNDARTWRHDDTITRLSSTAPRRESLLVTSTPFSPAKQHLRVSSLQTPVSRRWSMLLGEDDVTITPGGWSYNTLPKSLGQPTQSGSGRPTQPTSSHHTLPKSVARPSMGYQTQPGLSHPTQPTSGHHTLPLSAGRPTQNSRLLPNQWGFSSPSSQHQRSLSVPRVSSPPGERSGRSDALRVAPSQGRSASVPPGGRSTPLPRPSPPRVTPNRSGGNTPAPRPRSLAIPPRLTPSRSGGHFPTLRPRSLTTPPMTLLPPLRPTAHSPSPRPRSLATPPMTPLPPLRPSAHSPAPRPRSLADPTRLSRTLPSGIDLVPDRASILDRAQTLRQPYRGSLDRAGSARIPGRRPSQRSRHWDRERRLRKIRSKPLLDHSLNDLMMDTSHHNNTTVTFLEGLEISVN